MKYNRVVSFGSGRLYVGEGFQEFGNVNDIIDLYNDILRDLESNDLKNPYNFCIGFFNNGDFILYLYCENALVVGYKVKKIDESIIFSQNNNIEINDEIKEIMDIETRKEKIPQYPKYWKMTIIKDEIYPNLRQNIN